METPAGVARVIVEKDKSIWKHLEDFVVNSWNWLLEYQLLVLIVIVLFVIAYLIFMYFKRREKQVQKLWNFLLFFLSKRQMLIPLVITLSRRDGILDIKTQEFLLNIRKECRENPLENYPKKRLELEVEISKQLFFYFSELEKSVEFQRNKKLKKVVSDLEFIDEKLVQLQYLYNKESKRWNFIVYMFFPIFKFLGFKTFKKFELPN